jgi:hypothetical protein
VLLVAAAVVAVVGIVGFVRFKQYVDHDPRFCATCHRASPEFALWTEGSHKNISCQSCHHSTPGEGVAMLRAFLAGKTPSGSHGQVEVGACKSCHLSHDARWPQIGASRGHRVHVEKAGLPCVRCHGTTVHGFEPVSASCAAADCHPGHKVALEGMQRLHCFACHEFLSAQAGLRPTRRDCLRCHAAQGVKAPFREHGGPMEMSCAACHRPHAPAGQALVACTACHNRMAQGGEHARPGHARCVECHRPHLWAAEEADCVRCHARATAHAKGGACKSCHGFGGAPLPVRPAALP